MNLKPPKDPAHCSLTLQVRILACELGAGEAQILNPYQGPRFCLILSPPQGKSVFYETVYVQ